MFTILRRCAVFKSLQNALSLHDRSWQFCFPLVAKLLGNNETKCAKSGYVYDMLLAMEIGWCTGLFYSIQGFWSCEILHLIPVQ